ncbi:TFIIH/NER complex subunit [Thoreauomyces humboldtii]|nr:TFIIH/NER complex subunit [Thoreauomyces humboldtii]
MVAADAMAQLDADTCPVCKSQRYLNPNLKLLVSPCFHKMCETCINRIFLQGPAPCPMCRTVLRKQNFVAQTFEDLYVEREVQTRKRVARVYNKRLEDFKNNLRQYNDYLEDVEEILFNLINDVDVKKTEDRMEKYEKDHKDLINANLQKQLTEERMVQGRLDREKREKVIRKETYEQAVMEEAKVRQQAKDDIITRLAEDDDASAMDVVAEAHSRRRAAPDIDKLLQARIPTVNDDDGEEYYREFEELDSAPFDPMDHTYEIVSFTTVKDAYSDPWQNHLALNNPVRASTARAGGFSSKFVYERAITSAFAGIFAGV